MNRSVDYSLDDLCTYGRKFIVEPNCTSLKAEERDLLQKLQPAGIMLRSRNFLQDAPYPVWLDELAQLLQDIRAVISRRDLIVCIDHEGGRITRPPLPITRFPYASSYGERAADVAKSMAVELKSIGVNLSFAPVADIHSNPKNPVINERAFGQSADDVSKHTVDFYRALKENGVEGCAKHFPGHGDTSVDSHFELPILTLNLKQLRERELVPFRTLVEAGIGMIMTGHLMLPAVDTCAPATLSVPILDDLLRKEMNYSGVIVSDGLGMDAIRETLNDPAEVIRGVSAGLDLFLVAGDTVSVTDAVRWAEVMRDGVENGTIDRSAIMNSISRVDAFTESLQQYQPARLTEGTFAAHKLLAEALKPVTLDADGPELNGFM